LPEPGRHADKGGNDLPVGIALEIDDEVGRA
jgi:hypothetical protein